MAELGDRLKIIAGKIEKGETMADIGSDHGFLPVYLCENNICQKVIVTDISGASLQKARTAFSLYKGDAHVDFRVGDGLGPLSCGEVDTVVAAGMGGVTIIKILKENALKTLSFGRYILHPRNGAGKLRFWLERAGFSLVSEDIVRERKFFCEIMTVKPPGNIIKPPYTGGYGGEIEYEIPRGLTSGSEEIFAQFINNKLNIEKNILQAMINGNAADSEKIIGVKQRIGFLERLVKEVV